MLAGRRVVVAGVGIIQVIVPLGTGGLNLAVKKAASPSWIQLRVANLAVWKGCVFR